MLERGQSFLKFNQEKGKRHPSDSPPAYPSGERPLDACPEVIDLNRFSAFGISLVEEPADRTGARCEGPPSG